MTGSAAGSKRASFDGREYKKHRSQTEWAKSTGNDLITFKVRRYAN